MCWQLVNGDCASAAYARSNIAMKKRTLLLFAAVLTPFVLVAVYFEPTHCIRGHLWGEAFFENRPTSWWRHELSRWSILEIDSGPIKQPAICYFRRDPSWIEATRERWFPNNGPKRLKISFFGPKLLDGDADAKPVLQALLDDPSPEIRRFARIGLKLEKD